MTRGLCGATTSEWPQERSARDRRCRNAEASPMTIIRCRRRTKASEDVAIGCLRLEPKISISVGAKCPESGIVPRAAPGASTACFRHQDPRHLRRQLAELELEAQDAMSHKPGPWCLGAAQPLGRIPGRQGRHTPFAIKELGANPASTLRQQPTGLRLGLIERIAYQGFHVRRRRPFGVNVAKVSQAFLPVGSLAHNPSVNLSCCLSSVDTGD